MDGVVGGERSAGAGCVVYHRGHKSSRVERGKWNTRERAGGEVVLVTFSSSLRAASSLPSMALHARCSTTRPTTSDYIPYTSASLLDGGTREHC